MLEKVKHHMQFIIQTILLAKLIDYLVCGSSFIKDLSQYSWKDAFHFLPFDVINSFTSCQQTNKCMKRSYDLVT